MPILLSDAVLTGETLLLDYGVVFENTVIKVASHEALRQEYGDQCRYLGKGSVILPGLINAHVHLEFSANRTSLTYGGFMPWLSSVMANRDEMIGGCDEDCMRNAVDTMLNNGITAFGAVSSYGFDLEACAGASQKVVYFNELIGSDPAMADALYGNFQERLFTSMDIQREGFYPSIAIHSPYSVHRVLIQKALAYARSHNLRTTAHFMESPAEREWLDTNSGDFRPFFETFLRQSRAANTAEEFLSYFDTVPTLFTHVVHATPSELEVLRAHDHTVIHCPVSNRLLGNGAIDLDALISRSIRWVCGTDGLSSNYALDLFEEMKIALFMHHGADLNDLALQLWKSVTSDAADALRLNCGTIAPGYDADLVVVRVDYPINDQLPIHLLLHPRTIESVYIQGKKVKG
ncbi:MAG: aminofutalosine deaminase family hydrolase [Sulfuricurvum sp.]